MSHVEKSLCEVQLFWTFIQPFKSSQRIKASF